MIEIVVLIVLGRRIRAVAADHGRRPREMTALLVACWLGCQLAGMALAVAVDANAAGFYALALTFAGVGALAAFAVAGRGEPVPPGTAPEPPLFDRLAARRRPAVVGAAAAAVLGAAHVALVGRARGWWIVALLVADVAGLAWLATRARRPGVRRDVPARQVGRALLAVLVPLWAIASLLGALVLAFGDRRPDVRVVDLATVTDGVSSARARLPEATADPAWQVGVRITRCDADLPLLRATPEAWRVHVDVATGVDETYEENRAWTTAVGDVLGDPGTLVLDYPGEWYIGLPGSFDRLVELSTWRCVVTDEAGATALAASFREVAVRLIAFDPPAAA